MKILITGASGHIGTMLRQIFTNDDVTLLSRRFLAPRENEEWFHSGNIQDSGWWNSLPPNSHFDVIFHLAEPVKENINTRIAKTIVDGHAKFIAYFTNEGAKVIYPLTAYLYDRRLSRSNAAYAGIKRGVYEQLKSNARAVFPIIHPIRDSDHGLGKLIQLEKRMPFVNIMCAFESTMPVLTLGHFRQYFTNPKSMTPGRTDVYSEIVTMKHLFKVDTRTDVFALSRAFRRVLIFLSSVPSFNLLVQGRQIDASLL